MDVLIIAGILLLFISTIFYFRIEVIALFYRFVYGEYHIKYLNLFFKDNFISSNTYPTRNTLYNQVSNVKEALKADVKSDTSHPIYFQNIEYGISSKKLISIVGKPFSHHISTLGDERVVSLEYNLDRYNVVDKYVYYFRNDKYYMGEFHFNKIKIGVNNEILNSINSKYKTSFSEEDSFVISNRNKNLLYFSDIGFRIVVSYFNKDDENINELLVYLDEFISKRKAEYNYELDIQQLSF